MTQITISDELAERIASSAIERGCDKDELVSMLIEQSLRDETIAVSTPLAAEVQARLTHSIEQARRGELIPGEVMMSKLAALIEELDSK